MGHKIKETKLAELLLQSLLDSYDQLIINLTNNILTCFLNFDDVLTAIFGEESHRKIRKTDRQVVRKQML